MKGALQQLPFAVRELQRERVTIAVGDIGDNKLRQWKIELALLAASCRTRKTHEITAMDLSSDALGLTTKAVGVGYLRFANNGEDPTQLGRLLNDNVRFVARHRRWVEEERNL